MEEFIKFDEEDVKLEVYYPYIPLVCTTAMEWRCWPVAYRSSITPPKALIITCPKCFGTGWKLEGEDWSGQSGCPKCNGGGFIPAEETPEPIDWLGINREFS